MCGLEINKRWRNGFIFLPYGAGFVRDSKLKLLLHSLHFELLISPPLIHKIDKIIVIKNCGHDA